VFLPISGIITVVGNKLCEDSRFAVCS
jgi:hypothetical protein